MHFTYEPIGDADTHLRQGDVLALSPDLAGLLKNIFPYYADKTDNTFFVVLTQTCDLVRGRKGESCKARYIAIAPVRPLALVIARKIEEFNIASPYMSIPVCTDRAQSLVAQFLERLFNNNESDYFFLNADPSVGISDDSCVFLRLAIALRAHEQYDVLAAARIVSLTEVFQAKLGWLAGNLFSRVGTPDWKDEELRAKVDSAIAEEIVWVPSKKEKEIKRKIKEAFAEEGRQLDAERIEKILASIPSRRDQVIGRLEELIRASALVTEGTAKGVSGQCVKQLIDKITSDPKLSSYLS